MKKTDTNKDGPAGLVVPNQGIFENLLQSDFEQCFEQMRHYDDAFQSAVQFAYTGVVAVAGLSGTLIQIWSSKLSIATVSFIFAFSWLAGLLVVMSLAKNRVYFARVARYVNEIRELYLSNRPGGLTDKTKMYTNSGFPHVLDYGSTQSFQIYVASAFDSFLFATAVIAFIALTNVANGAEPSVGWFWGTTSFGACLLVELGSIILYWHLEESKMKPKNE